MASPPKASPRAQLKALQMSIFLLLQATLFSASILLSRPPPHFRRSRYNGHPLSKSCILDSFVFPFSIHKLNITTVIIIVLPDRPQPQSTILSLSRFSDALLATTQTGSGAYLSARQRGLQLGHYRASFSFRWGRA